MNVPIEKLCDPCKKIAREENKKRQRKYRSKNPTKPHTKIN